ncbi:MAG: signal peptide protein [Myxococcaceae bacterium]|nr:signal peptide protein [Myxococcaceae bacterium]
MRASPTLLLLVGLSAFAEQPAMVKVGPGVYRPIYPAAASQTELTLPGFLLDVTPVTNGALLAFVTAQPQWRRDRVKRVFADRGYLQHWEGPLKPGEADPDQPARFVSWFVARAYCAHRGARLPTEAEWELAAAADETELDARRTPAFRDRLLAWYAQPNPARLPKVGAGKPNAWGLHDLHGLLWEWVLDFGNTMISSDSRDGKDPSGRRFCGAGAANASEKDDYPSFMRIAFRSSLEGNYTIGNLGFRCARDLSGVTR